MPHKSVWVLYGSDKRDPIWPIWLSVIYGLRETGDPGARWSGKPLLGRSALDRGSTILYFHACPHPSIVNIFFVAATSTKGEEANPFCKGLTPICNCDQLSDIFGVLTSSVIKEIFETRARGVYKRSSHHRPFVSPALEYSFWTSAVTTFDLLLNLQHFVASKSRNIITKRGILNVVISIPIHSCFSSMSFIISL